MLNSAVLAVADPGIDGRGRQRGSGIWSPRYTGSGDSTPQWGAGAEPPLVDEGMGFYLGAPTETEA